MDKNLRITWGQLTAYLATVGYAVDTLRPKNPAMLYVFGAKAAIVLTLHEDRIMLTGSISSADVNVSTLSFEEIARQVRTIAGDPT